MTLVSKEHLVNDSSPGTPSAPLAPSVTVNMAAHPPTPTSSIYPVQDVNSVTPAEDAQEERNQLLQGELSKLNELKQLSKKIEKDLEAMKKQGKELERKLRKKETPPRFCFFLDLKTGALIVGLVSMVIYTILLLAFSVNMNERFTVRNDNNENAKTQAIFSLNGVVLMSVLCVLMALFKSNLLLLAVYLNHKSYVRIYLALTVFFLNWFLVYCFGAAVGAYNFKDSETIGKILVYFAVYEGFALFNVLRYYRSMD